MHLQAARSNTASFRYGFTHPSHSKLIQTRFFFFELCGRVGRCRREGRQRSKRRWSAGVAKRCVYLPNDTTEAPGHGQAEVMQPRQTAYWTASACKALRRLTVRLHWSRLTRRPGKYVASRLTQCTVGCNMQHERVERARAMLPDVAEMGIGVLFVCRIPRALLVSAKKIV